MQMLQTAFSIKLSAQGHYHPSYRNKKKVTEAQNCEGSKLHSLNFISILQNPHDLDSDDKLQELKQNYMNIASNYC